MRNQLKLFAAFLVGLGLVGAASPLWAAAKLPAIAPVVISGATAPHTLTTPPAAAPALTPQPAPVAVSSLAYFPILSYDAPEDAAPELIPVASNQSLMGTSHAGIKRAIIVIHDYNRDATRTLAAMTGLTGGGNGETLILAPEFLLESDITRLAKQLPDGGRNCARWPLGNWSQGGDSLGIGPQKGISSFTAIDLLLIYLSDKSLFPDMTQIIVAGHGEGGDFVQRYAAAARAPDVLQTQNLPVRFLVANPSSYLYFTPVRFLNNKAGFGGVDPQQCKDYDAWPYGLDALNDYVKRVGANALKLRYSGRHVSYLVGANVAANDPSPDASCAALAEGADRVARQANYDRYLGITFGEDIGKTQSLVIVPNVGYDAPAMFGSICGIMTLFGDGSCASVVSPR